MGKPKTPQFDGVLDIETEDWTQPVFLGLKFRGQSSLIVDWTHEREFLETLFFGRNADVWAHNGGKFDTIWAIDRAIRWFKIKPEEVTTSGSRVLSVKLGKVRLRDSYALFPQSLAKLTRLLTIAKEELDLPCRCGDDCGGYCSIARGLHQWHPRIRQYLEKDLTSLEGALVELEKYTKTAGLRLRTTVGATAWATAMEVGDLPEADLSPSWHMFIRDAYFGGRVTVGKTSAGRGRGFDVNSMYPDKLANYPMPWGKPRKVHADKAREAFDAGLLGFYKCRVYVPVMLFGPLPVRTRLRVCYPTGTLDGTWAAPELAFAVSQGCRIEAFESAVVYPSSRVLLKTWTDKMFNLRREAPGGKSGPMGTFVKLVINSLYGKMGANPERECLEFPEKDQIRCCTCKRRRTKWCECGGKCCVDSPYCVGDCGAHRRVSEDSDLAFTTTEFDLRPYSHIEWAAYVTAYSRVLWLKTAIENGVEHVVYGDTDSLYLEGVTADGFAGDKGSTLGTWEPDPDGDFARMEVVAPKVYMVEYLDGHTKVKAKGLRLPGTEQGDIDAFRKGAGLPQKGVRSLKTGLRAGEIWSKAKPIVRKLRGQAGWIGDRVLLSDGSTRAPTIDEALERDK